MRETVAFAALLCGTICLNSQPALADNGSVTTPKGGLEHVTWPHARLKLQIIDDTPEVTDCRNPNNSQTYRVNIPPMPTASASAPIDIGPNGSGSFAGAPQGGSPGTITINNGRLPPSRFDSNLPASGPMTRKGLPDASSSNRLGNKAFLQGSMLRPSVVKPRPANAIKPTSAASPTTETYDPAPSVSGSSGSTTVGSVKGWMLAPKTASQH